MAKRNPRKLSPVIPLLFALLAITAGGSLAAELQLLSPSQRNLTLEWGQKCDIRWATTLQRSEQVTIWLRDSDGGEWQLAAVRGACRWIWHVGKGKGSEPPGYAKGVGYRIRLTARGGLLQDESNHDFAIGSPTSIEITGPDTVAQDSTEQYRCMANYDVGTMSDVTAQARWKASSPFASMGNDGLLQTKFVPGDQACPIAATYGKGRAALEARREVTISSTPPERLEIQDVAISAPDSVAVPQYGKLELLVTLSHVAATKFYDPDPSLDGLSITSTFTSPGGADWNVNGFYDGARWLIRFAPNEVGAWRFTVRAEDKSGVATWDAGAFACASSDYPGWPRISGHNLRLASGQSFLAIGHNTGWQYDVEQPPPAQMAAQGENLLSFWLAVPWARPSWTSPSEPWWAQRAAIENAEGGLGEYEQAACEYLDDVVARAEEAGILLLPTIWSHGQLRDVGHPWGAGWWSDNPYSDICTASDFFKMSDKGEDTPQWRYQKNFLRYLVARWGYSRAVAGWVVMCELNGTTGFVVNRAQAEAWCAAANAHMRQLDPFRRNDAGQYPAAATVVDQPAWDLGYDARATDTYQQKNSDSGIAPIVASQTAIMRSFGVPGFHAEFGGDTLNGASQPTHLHNGIWAGVMTGAAITPLLWCDGGNYPMLTSEMSAQIGYLAEFTSQLDYLADSSAMPVTLVLNPPSCRGWGMSVASRACAWVQNTSGTMGGQTLTIYDMPDGCYDVAWYDVWSSGASPFATDAASSGGGRMQLAVPALERADAACRIEPAGVGASKTERATAPPDTPRAARSTAHSPGALRTSGSATRMEFSRDGVNGTIAAAVERVAGKGRVQVATARSGEATMACLVIDAEQRCYELDAGIRAEMAPSLAAAGLGTAPDSTPHIMSICRSVAKLAMGYQAENGDKVIIILCPQSQWAALKLQWPQ